jgi:hypothetical protein
VRFLALCVGRAFHVETVVASVVRLTDEGVRVHQETFGAMELDAIAAEMARLVASIPGSQPQPGSHCHEKWCPAVAACPATTKATAIVAPGEPMPEQITRPEQVALLRDRIAVIRAACDQREELWQTYVREHGSVPLPDGRVLCATTEERASIEVTPEAEAILMRLAPGSIKPTTTKTAIANNVQRVLLSADKATVKARIAEVMSELSRADAIRTKTISTFRVRGAKEK